MNIDRNRLIWLTVGGLLLAGTLYIALNWFEIVDQPEWVGAEGEARTDPYLAMKRLLAGMGAQIVTVRQYSEIDGLAENATLLLGDQRLARMSPARVAGLVAWVRSGGHLVVEAEQPRLDDPLLAAFGLSHVGLRWTLKGLRERNDKNSRNDQGDRGDPKAEKSPDTDDADDEPGIDAESLPEGDAAPAGRGQIKLPVSRGTEVSIVNLPDGARFKVVFAPYQNLRVRTVRENVLAVRDQAGLRLVQFAEGSGRVTAISNFDFMTWRSISKQDHAEFLWRVVAGPGPDAKPGASYVAKPLVVLALRNTEGGLWKWLVTHAWMVLWALLVLLLTWVVRVVSRFGSLLPELPTARLSLAEHLAAMGRYIGRRHGWAALLHAARERFIMRLHHQRPGLHRTDGAALVMALEQLTGIGAARIQRALYLGVNDRRTFGEAIRTLKALEQILTPVPQARLRAGTRAPTTLPSN